MAVTDQRPPVSSERRAELEAFLIAEAELLDTRRFMDWNQLFTDDGMYWIPLDPERDPDREWSIVYDDALRREERVYHLTEVPFPSQQPPSRTLHVIGNLRVIQIEEGFLATTNQIIYELRLGDFRQVGLGEQRSFAATVEHRLVAVAGALRIQRKTVNLLNRGAALGNLTFLL